jgi:L-cysteine S-thiosulfotransferase
MGPPLSEIRERYPDMAKLRAIIWDLGSTVPGTIMPPYGRHRILTDAEIDAVVGYIKDL